MFGELSTIFQPGSEVLGYSIQPYQYAPKESTGFTLLAVPPAICFGFLRQWRIDTSDGAERRVLGTYCQMGTTPLGPEMITRVLRAIRVESSAFSLDSVAPADDKRNLTVIWDGFDGVLEGEITYRYGEQEGSMLVFLPDLQTRCSGSYQALDQTRGNWSVSCPDGLSASGSYGGLGTGKGSEGQGVDSQGRQVRFTVGPAE